MQWLAEICVRRPVLASVLSLVILVVGTIFYTRLGVDQFPKVDVPVVIVLTSLPGSSPEDVEREITDKIEGAVNTISGIDELRSISSEGLSQVIVQFLLEKDTDIAAQEVQQKINGILPELPEGVDPPVVQKFDPDAQPILYIALNASSAASASTGATPDIREITDLADRVVRRRLESVSGVGQVLILGGRKRQIEIAVDPVKLKALSLSPVEVARAVAAQNMTLPGGRLDTSRDYLTLRVAGRVRSIDELRDIVVKDVDGRAVRLSEVAEVTDGLEDPTTSAMWNDDRTVVLTIRKQSGTNTVAVVDAVKARLDDIQKELPDAYSLTIQRDGSAVIRTATAAVTEHLILGSIFAAIIVLLFLGNVRSTFIAAIAIPTSIIGTFAMMKLAGYTLNSITLLALALAVGIVIDDAIVILENIFKQVDEHGMHPQQAAIVGTREIGPAVMATTLSLIAVFLPIAFVAGVPGRFLASFGITMSFAIAVSLFVSFTLTPMLASRLLRMRRPGEDNKGPFERLVDFVYHPIHRFYEIILGFSMKHRWVIVVASVLALVSMGPLLKVVHKGFLPIDDRAQFEVVIRLPEGRSVAATELVGQRVARKLRAFDEVVATLTTVGDDPAKTPNLARIYVKMTPPDHRTITQNEFKDVIRQQVLPDLPKNWRVNVTDVNEFGGGQPQQRIQYTLAGPDLEFLQQANEQILKAIRAVPDAVDVDSSLIVGKPELEITVDRDRAADLGVQVADVATALQFAIASQKVSTFAENGEQYDIRLRASEAYRSREDQLLLINVPSRKLGQVSLADVVQIRPGSGPSNIDRFQRERQVTFLANGKPGADESAIAAAALKAIQSVHPPKGFSIKPQGQTKMMRDTGLSFIFGLGAAFVFMYLILAAQFESWLHPVTILLSLPLTLPFAILSVVLFKQALDIYSFLGIFVLFGVVKKNAILQIDHTNQLRERHKRALTEAIEAAKDSKEARRIKKRFRLEAIMKGNLDRLRPILMTTFAFVAGMIPLVTARGVGSGYNRATAGVVVGGQLFSLGLTLLAVPVAYSFFDDISAAAWWLVARVRRKLGWTPAPPPPTESIHVEEPSR